MVSVFFFCCLLAMTVAKPVHLVDDSIVPYNNNKGIQDIVNGEDAEYGLFNYILSLDEGDSSICGATLVSSTRAITAAHCLDDGGSYSVEAGQLDFNHFSGHEVSRPVKEFIKHPNYDPDDNWRNDIAILKFDPIPLGQYIQPIGMITDSNEDLTSMRCWIAGWGKTSGNGDGSDVLQYSAVNVMTNSACDNYWSGIFSTQVCVAFFQYDVSACGGDSGGPLTCETENGEKLAGVTSWAHEDCLGSSPSVYVRVSEYKDWIAQNL